MLCNEIYCHQLISTAENDMGMHIIADVSLIYITNFFQIPAASLSRGRNRAPLASEVAVVVKDKSRGTQGKSLAVCVDNFLERVLKNHAKDHISK